MLKVDFKGDWDAARRDLEGFSERRLRATMATALSRTAAEDVRPALKRELQVALDRPTEWTLNSLFVSPATADKLVAEVWFKDGRAASGGGTPAAFYLLPQVEGGNRRMKRFELALQAIGAMPKGFKVMPGAGAVVDSHGNMALGQIKQILAQLRAAALVGPSRTTAGQRVAALRKAGGSFFVIRPGGKTQPGVYQRELFGRNITPVMVFVRDAVYQKLYRFPEVAERTSSGAFPRQLDRAIVEQRARLAARGARG